MSNGNQALISDLSLFYAQCSQCGDVWRIHHRVHLRISETHAPRQVEFYNALTEGGLSKSKQSPISYFRRRCSVVKLVKFAEFAKAFMPASVKFEHPVNFKSFMVLQ